MVAVKTFKVDMSREVVEEFIHIAKPMFIFNHPNIITMYDVYMSTLPYCRVFEFMDKENLAKFLQRCYLNSMHSLSH